MEDSSNLRKRAFKEGFIAVLNKIGLEKSDIGRLCSSMTKQAGVLPALTSLGNFGINAAKGIGSAAAFGGNILKDIAIDAPIKLLPMFGGLGIAGGLVGAYGLSAYEANRLRAQEKSRQLDNLLKNQYAMQQYIAHQEALPKEEY